MGQVSFPLGACHAPTVMNVYDRVYPSCHGSRLARSMKRLASSSPVNCCMARSHLSERFMVESMVDGVVAELMVGIARDESFGPHLVVGAGGILVELMSDSVSLLLPTSRSAVLNAINSLSSVKLLLGFRGKPPGDIEAVVDAVMAIASFAEDHWEQLLELDVNPLMVLPQGQGVIAADALIALA